MGNKLQFFSVSLKREISCSHCEKVLPIGHLAYVRIGIIDTQFTYCDIECHNSWEHIINLLYGNFRGPDSVELTFDERPPALNSEEFEILEVMQIER